MRVALILLSVLFFLVGNVEAQDAGPIYEPSDCPFGGSDQIQKIECGYLIVPENRDRPDGRTLRLAVALLHSLSDVPTQAPLVFVEGGPGGKSLERLPSRLRNPLWNRLRQQRDVIFYDQRGAGYSEPAFCPEWNVATSKAALKGLSIEENKSIAIEAASTCRRQMLQEGLDFASYNSATSARDLDDLRRALGYQQWNLFGISYGTRLALTAMRDTPEGIRSVVLEGTSPLSARSWIESPAKFVRSLQLVFDQCADDEACRNAFPMLEEDFYAVLDSLQQRPVVLAMPDTTRFPDGRMVIDGAAFASGIFQGLYNRNFISILPLTIREAKARNIDVMTAIANGLVRDPHNNNSGLRYAVHCYERAPFNPQEKIEAEHAKYPGLSVWSGNSNYHAVCDAWHDARADSIEAEPVESQIPALLLVGEFDPVTPPAYSRLAAETLPNSRLVEVRGIGHQFAPFECTRNVTASFLDDPSQPLDTSCVEDLPPLRFVSNMHLNPGIYRLGIQLQQRPSIPVLVGVGLIVLLLLSAVLLWPADYLIRRIRKQEPQNERMQRGARWMAGGTCLLILGFLAGVIVVMMQTAAKNPFLLAFGIPGDAGWLFILPWIVLVLTLGVTLLALLSWKKRWWTPRARIHYTLIAAACLGAVIVIGIWGLV